MTILELVEPLSIKLKSKTWKMVTAESCTGGGLSYYLTAMAGSSDWFDRGYITYSNQSKVELLGVKTSSLEEHGAVSEQVAKEMAQNALARSLAHLSVSITGIAGPAGGTPDKPVGTVYIGVASIEIAPRILSYTFKGDRSQIREQAIRQALTQVLSIL